MASTLLQRNPGPKGQRAYTVHETKRLYMWFGMCPVEDLEMEACRYLGILWARGYSPSYLQVAVSALLALEDLGRIPHMVTNKVWQCSRQPKERDATRPYAGLEELRLLAQVCSSHDQWTLFAMAAISFTCLLRVGEASPLRRGGSRAKGLLFITVKNDPRLVVRALGAWPRAWLKWLDKEGWTGAAYTALICPQGAHYHQEILAWSLQGAEAESVQWNAWRRGGAAAVRWLGLSVPHLAWWGRRLSESVTAEYGDAPNDFSVADNVFPLAV